MSNVSTRIISNYAKRSELFDRLNLFCKQNDLSFKILQNEPYWKIDGAYEILIELENPPVWNYGKWGEAYKFLFDQDFTIEWEPNEDICLCYYPEVEDFDSYFVIFRIPSHFFVPKPSKDIRH